MQYQSDGKPCKKPANSRTVAGLKRAVEKLGLELSGNPVEEPKVKTLEAAIEDWLAFRTAENRGNEKAKLMGRILVEWMKDREVTFLGEITTNLTSHFFMDMSKRFSHGTSGSLKTHWSMIKALFRWATEEKLIPENPLPRRKITFKKPEVIPPTKKEVEKMIATANGMDRLFVLTMRHSGMAIRDTTMLSRSKLTDHNLIRGNRAKTNERYRVRIPVWLGETLLALPGEYFFWDGVTLPKTMVRRWGKRLSAMFETAGVNMTSHKFRHYFITEQLAAGVGVEDVSKMVGTSPAEIRKTYEHWIREAEDRLDTVQSTFWLKQGFDKNGNPKEMVQ